MVVSQLASFAWAEFQNTAAAPIWCLYFRRVGGPEPAGPGGHDRSANRPRIVTQMKHGTHCERIPRQLVKKNGILNKSENQPDTTWVICAPSGSYRFTEPSPRPSWRTSPEAPGKAGSALIDATLSSDECFKGLGLRLAHRSVPHHARPLAPCPFIDFRRIRRAPNDRGKGVFSFRYIQQP
jgi:hypothetical protein